MMPSSEGRKDVPRLLAINNYFYRRGGAEAIFFDHMALFAEIGMV